MWLSMIMIICYGLKYSARQAEEARPRCSGLLVRWIPYPLRPNCVRTTRWYIIGNGCSARAQCLQTYTSLACPLQAPRGGRRPRGGANQKAAYALCARLSRALVLLAPPDAGMPGNLYTCPRIALGLMPPMLVPPQLQLNRRVAQNK